MRNGRVFDGGLLAITFYTVDIGHGLCQLIMFGGRRAILIDGGGRIGKLVAEDFLKRYVDTIVAYVATHNDSDHVQAAPEILDHYPTARSLHHIWLLFDRPAKRPEQTDNEVITLLGYSKRRETTNTIAGRHALYVDDTGLNRPKVIHREAVEAAELQLFYPKPLDVTNAFLRGNPDAEATNESSAVLRLVVGERTSRAAVLLTGDANCRSFQLIHEKYRFDLRARALAVPHHGGHIPQPAGAISWDRIVDLISPEIAVISAGYGTVPGTTTTQRTTFDPLRNRGTKICCTQITKHCHPNFGSLHPSVLSINQRPYPQMSGRRQFPNAVACGGTIAVAVKPTGDVELLEFNPHQQAINAKVVPAPGCPHCR